MRGSTPLDVAAASCIDNNELALALQEQDLEMVGKTWQQNQKNMWKNLTCPRPCSFRWWLTWPAAASRCARCSSLRATLTLAGTHVEERDTWTSSALLSLSMVRTSNFYFCVFPGRVLVNECPHSCSHRRERGGECQRCGAAAHPSARVLWPRPERRGRERPAGRHGGRHQDLGGSGKGRAHCQEGPALHVGHSRADVRLLN